MIRLRSVYFRKWRRWGFLLTAALWTGTGWSQTELNFSRLGGAVRLLNSDLAVLESAANRTDLACQVSPTKPELGFDLRFHVEYGVNIPLQELAGSGTQLRILIRVTPLENKENQVYLVDRFSVPPIEEDAKGQASFTGGFALGPGRYKVDWFMRDRKERICSLHWETEAKMNGDNEDLPLTMLPNTVAQRPQEPFGEEPPVERVATDRLLHVKILANFSPTNPHEATLKPWDIDAIVSILRSIAREPKFGRFSLVAFNMQQEQVIYREDNVERIDFPELGKAVAALKLGTVDYHRLQDQQSGTRFLARLLAENLSPQDPEPDAIIIAGPKLMLEKKVSQEELREAGSARCPIFYLNYNFDPRGNPWRDAISSALKAYKGALQYSIALPRDLGAAVNDMMFRMSNRN